MTNIPQVTIPQAIENAQRLSPNSRVNQRKTLAAYIAEHAKPVVPNRLRASANVAADGAAMLNGYHATTGTPGLREVCCDVEYIVAIPADWYEVDAFEYPLSDAVDAIFGKTFIAELPGYSMVDPYVTVGTRRLGIGTFAGEPAFVIKFTLEINVNVVPPVPAEPQYVSDDYVAALNAEVAANRASTEGLAASR